MSEFKVGDLVTLKSGSPIMTVAALPEGDTNMQVIWMPGGSDSQFLPNTLEASPDCFKMVTK